MATQTHHHHHHHHLISVLLVLFLSFLPFSKPDLQSDKTALLAFKAAIRKSLPWNSSLPVCQWQGIQCETSRVTVLRLPANALVGVIPPATIGNLTGLRTLSLRLNALAGPLPSDIARCTQLRNLYLQGNRFSGAIPPFIFSLQNLVRLNLAANNFSGHIPPDFNRLSRLGTLYLENNHFDGPIPELKLPGLVQFNVSFNQLNGSIPLGLRTHSADSFLGNSLCGRPLIPCPGEESNSIGSKTTKKKKKLSGGAIAGIAVGSAVLILVILLLLVACCRKKSSEKTRSVDALPKKETAGEEMMEKAAEGGERENGAIPAAAAATAAAVEVGKKKAVGETKKLVFFGKARGGFDLDALLGASAEVLGKGSFGTAFKAVLEGGVVVAVKRLKEVGVEEKEFREKIEAIGSMEHENLVSLRAYYYSRDEKLLVYDYMTMGSLSALLHGNQSFLFFLFQ